MTAEAWRVDHTCEAFDDWQADRLAEWLADNPAPDLEAEYQRRLATYRQTGYPCDRLAAEAINPRRNDPAWVDVPEWLMIRAEMGD